MMLIAHSLTNKKNRCPYVLLPILCSSIPDLALGILEMLICVYCRDVLQPTLY